MNNLNDILNLLKHNISIRLKHDSKKNTLKAICALVIFIIGFILWSYSYHINRSQISRFSSDPYKLPVSIKWQLIITLALVFCPVLYFVKLSTTLGVVKINTKQNEPERRWYNFASYILMILSSISLGIGVVDLKVSTASIIIALILILFTSVPIIVHSEKKKKHTSDDNINWLITFMPNLKSLYLDMKHKHVTISSFHFKYIDYYNVLIRKSSQSLCKLGYNMNLEFINKANTKSHLSISINPFSGHTADIHGKNSSLMWKKLKKYFGVNPNLNETGLFKAFYSILDQHVPAKVPKSYAIDLKMDMIYALGYEDPLDTPEKIYLYTLRRNPKGYKRSIFNSEKTRLRYPKVYKDISSHSTNFDSISFVYTSNKKYKNTYKKFEKK